jgi:uncharacterized membrane protein
MIELIFCSVGGIVTCVFFAIFIRYKNLLPRIYYVLAIFCLVVALIAIIVLSGRSSAQWMRDFDRSFGLLGSLVGVGLFMFTVGRVIEVLQQIRDAVRNIPALSPGKPDESDSPGPRTGDKS